MAWLPSNLADMGRYVGRDSWGKSPVIQSVTVTFCCLALLMAVGAMAAASDGPATQPAAHLPLVLRAELTPTATATPTVGPCDCDGPDLDCRDFPSHDAAQACFDFCYPDYGDVFGLDGDGDLLACEHLP